MYTQGILHHTTAFLCKFAGVVWAVCKCPLIYCFSLAFNGYPSLVMTKWTKKAKKYKHHTLLKWHNCRYEKRRKRQEHCGKAAHSSVGAAQSCCWMDCGEELHRFSVVEIRAHCSLASCLAIRPASVILMGRSWSGCPDGIFSKPMMAFYMVGCVW